MDSKVGEMFNLAGRTAVVTGGAGNLGSEYVKTLAQAGASVAVFDIADKKNPKLEELLKSGHPVKIYKIDLTKKNEVEKALAEASGELGVPTILINNAGLDSHPSAPAAQNGPFEDYPEEVWDAMLDSHLKGMFFMSQAFIRNFRSAKKTSGSIINVSSTYGLVTPPQAMYEFRRRKGETYYKPVGYSVAKSGVLNFTRWLAEYAAPFGIRVNTLVPGGVYAGQDPEFVREYESRTMLGRMAEAHDYNGAVLFLASDASSYMTGSTLVVDGGWTAR
ncbi:TPA: short-chain dehydrogenase [Candidatus Giovannonibacteria bacterium]|nr:short-chain dehydrogenase [Candidatus Giovannonibacteria bacterium]